MNQTNPLLNLHNPQNGFSLIELMVAIAIGMFVLLGAIQIFLSNQAGYRLVDGLAKTQENGRFALELLSRDLRMAGFPADDFAGNRIRGVESGSTDSVTIQYTVETDTSDCGGTTILADATLQHTYSVDGTNLLCTGASGTDIVIIEGAEKMQILYGEDTDSTNFPNRYVTASQLAVTPAGGAQTTDETDDRWDNIATVRLNILINSVDPTVENPQTYYYDGASVLASDLLFRQEYTTTITLRNKAL